MKTYTVEWTLDKEDFLAIKFRGNWYGFLVERHPSEVHMGSFHEGNYIPFGEDIVSELLLNASETKTYEYTLED